MKNAYHRVEAQLCISITSALGGIVSFTHRPFYPEGIRHRYPFYSRLEFIPEPIWKRSQRTHFLTPTGTEPWSCTPHADHYAHRVVSADICRGFILIYETAECTGSPRFAPVQFAPIQNNADFETRRSKSQKNIFYYYL
jgi:hypothetical protein